MPKPGSRTTTRYSAELKAAVGGWAQALGHT